MVTPNSLELSDISYLGHDNIFHSIFSSVNIKIYELLNFDKIFFYCVFQILLFANQALQGLSIFQDFQMSHTLLMKGMYIDIS